MLGAWDKPRKAHSKGTEFKILPRLTSLQTSLFVRLN